MKAFNTVYYETLRMEGGRTDRHRLVFFIAGTDEEAKALVSRLIEEIGSSRWTRVPWVKADASSSRVHLSTTICDCRTRVRALARL